MAKTRTRTRKSTARKTKARRTKAPKRASSRRAAPKHSVIGKIKKMRLKDKVLLDIPHYPQTEDFTSSAACAMMVLKFINPGFKFKREHEYEIWQEAVNGSVWYGSKYGLAYALSKRGANVGIISNTKNEGYERKMAVYENVNLDTLTASFNEIKQKSENAGVEEDHGVVSLVAIKKALSSGHIPIVLIDARVVNSYLDSMPHWVVVKGYDKDTFYINDPYSDSTITLDTNAFKSALGFEQNYHMVAVHSKPAKKK
ncbi:MAG: peptidase C39 family protein [Candidatus Marsarchaeota archaeon]|nr:peptidase C39 family protein [Candidatus Marsarchaeota archaeon]